MQAMSFSPRWFFTSNVSIARFISTLSISLSSILFLAPTLSLTPSISTLSRTNVTRVFVVPPSIVIYTLIVQSPSYIFLRAD